MTIKKARTIIWFCITFICALLFWFSVSYPGDKQLIRNYDERSNLDGYTVREGNKETRYDRHWNRKGYSIYEDDRKQNFDGHWQRQSYERERRTLLWKEN